MTNGKRLNKLNDIRDEENIRSAFHPGIDFLRRSYSSIISPSTASERWSLQYHLKSWIDQRGGVDVCFIPCLPTNSFWNLLLNGLTPLTRMNQHFLARMCQLIQSFVSFTSRARGVPFVTLDCPSPQVAPVPCARN